ncbi:MAG TPA: hydrogenase/urease maturation nickel metallochaperone HypA [bacterium]|nr:hydrogenase/urease maturation nickel metallochaperone HypA [bacterium]
MHEAGIVKDLIRAVETAMTAEGGMRAVRKVYIRLGNDARIGSESLRMWFEVLSKGTALEGAAVDISLSNGADIVVESIEGT